ncbi:MAG: flagellar brake protein [Gammaproteobacteria bacterium]|nr:flagellar brake protein [Gammaproteobacteria bacterium]MDH5593671.1 flagellar brake protein [Gammaproteobacteria bacterium]
MAENNKSSNYDSQTEKISNPARITAILKNIIEARTLLRVTLPGSPKGYNSALLEVNREGNYVLLDELNPKEGHDILLKAKKLAVFTHLNGVDVGFIGHLADAFYQDDIAVYRVQLPKILNYHQLRQHFRIPIGITEIPVKIIIDNEITLEGELHDISSGGLCIRFTTEVPANLKRGKLADSCVVDFPDGNRLESKFEIRYRGNEDEKKRTLIGGQFVNLERNKQRMIERYVASLDREMRRKS